MSLAEDQAGHPPASLLQELTGTLASARAALANFLELLALEARRAGLAVVWMIAMGLAAAVFGITAWLGLMAALAMWLVSLGFPPVAAVLVLAGLNLAATAALAYRCIGMSRDLVFPATRRQITGAPPAPPPVS